MSEKYPTVFELVYELYPSLEKDKVYGKEAVDIIYTQVSRDLCANLYENENESYLKRILHLCLKQARIRYDNGYEEEEYVEDESEDDEYEEEEYVEDESETSARTRNQVKRTKEGIERSEKEYEKDKQRELNARLSSYRKKCRLYKGMRLFDSSMSTIIERIEKRRKHQLDPAVREITREEAAVTFMKIRQCSEDDVFGDYCNTVEDMLEWEKIMMTIVVV